MTNGSSTTLLARRFGPSAALACLLILALVALLKAHWAGRDFGHAEDWAVYAALRTIERGGFIEQMAGSLIGQDGGYAPLTVWLGLVGTDERAARHLSALSLALALAVAYRGVSDSFGRRAGLLGLVALGTSLFTLELAGGAIPFSALLAAAGGLHLSYGRWRRRPGRRIGAVLVLLAYLTAAIYPPAIWLLAGLAAYALMFDRSRATLTLVGLAALASVPRALAAGAYLDARPLEYSIWRAFEMGSAPLDVVPGEFIQTMLLVGTAALAGSIGLLAVRRRGIWAGAYWLIAAGVIVVVTALTPTRMAPVPFLLLAFIPLAALAGAVMAAMPLVGRGALLALLIGPAALSARTPDALVSFRAVAGQVAPDARAVIAAPYAWQHVPLSAYLTRQGIGDERQFHVLLPGQAVDWSYTTHQADAEAWPRYLAFIEAAPEVVYMAVGSADAGRPFEGALLEGYASLSGGAWRAMRDYPQDYGGWRRYARVPEGLADVFVYGAVLRLRQWTLLDSVEAQPCQPVRVRSWWWLRDRSYINLSMTLVIADEASGQGIARMDRLVGGVETVLLAAGSWIVDERAVTVPCDAAPGAYTLLLGIYTLTPEGVPLVLPVTLADGAPLGEIAYLTTLFVR